MGKLLCRVPVLLFLFGSFLLGSYHHHHNSNGGPFLGVDAHSHHHHGHSHNEEDHNAEPVAYKYSREANQPVEHHGHDHDHDHDHHGSHVHDHTHGHHIHDEVVPRTNHADDHQHYGHTHGPGGCSHTHSHDAHTHAQHGHSTSDPKPSLKQRILKKDEDVYNPNGYLWFMNDAYTRLWVLSIGSTVLISIAPFLILAVIPVQANTAENEPLLKVLLSFGSGGLLGDAFLHLIPHAQPAANDAHAHSHSHGAAGGHAHGPHDMSVGAYVLAGIIAFLTVEKLVRIFRGEDGGGHGHSHGLVVQKEGHKGKKRSNKADKAKKSDASSAEESCDDDDGEGENCKLIAHKPKHTGFKVAAYLNMAADFTHNFTDGLAIGASYLAGTTIGLVTMLTVLVHEVPHEIGDFAILVQSGFSKKRAMCVQLLTAVGAISGCVLSLLTADAHNLAEAAAASWVLPFTAGGFIYIATVSVIPELLVNSSPWQSIKEIIALLTGIALMYLIAIFE